MQTGLPGGRRADSVGTMALKARSPIVAMDANPLSEAQTARLLAAECYRLKFAHSRLSDEICILKKAAGCRGTRVQKLEPLAGNLLDGIVEAKFRRLPQQQFLGKM